MPRLRSVSLRIHLSPSTATYLLVHRTQDGNVIRDRRLDMGVLRYSTRGDHPVDVLPLLQRAVWDLERKRGVQPARSASAPPEGATGGRRVQESPDMPEWAVGLGDPELEQPLPGL